MADSEVLLGLELAVKESAAEFVVAVAVADAATAAAVTAEAEEEFEDVMVAELFVVLL